MILLCFVVIYHKKTSRFIMLLKFNLSVESPGRQEQQFSFLIDTERQSFQPDSEGKITFANTSVVIAQPKPTLSFQHLIGEAISEKSKHGHVRTAETYKSALNSFNRFVHRKVVALNEVTSSLMTDYENYLKQKGVCMNSISFYMRILKAIYRRAINLHLVDDCMPFKNVYTGVAKTTKRAVGIDVIRKIKSLEPLDENERLARDMFLFSFYTRGMSFIDMAYLKKTDLKDGFLYYTRKKTGQNLCIKWGPHMQNIVDSYPSCNDTYLLPIIHDDDSDGRNQYKYRLCVINKSLNAMAKRLSLSCNLTMYVARHSWASIARSIDIPLSIISDAMGHTSEKMTTIYLKSIDQSRIHNENDRLINLIHQD